MRQLGGRGETKGDSKYGPSDPTEGLQRKRRRQWAPPRVPLREPEFLQQDGLRHSEITAVTSQARSVPTCHASPTEAPSGCLSPLCFMWGAGLDRETWKPPSLLFAEQAELSPRPQRVRS